MQKTIVRNKELTWKYLFKRFACIYFFVGHKTTRLDDRRKCVRCGEEFFVARDIVQTVKKLNKNKNRQFGKRFYKR